MLRGLEVETFRLDGFVCELMVEALTVSVLVVTARLIGMQEINAQRH